MLQLMGAALRPPPGKGRVALALGMGIVTHLAFAGGVLAMMIAMFNGMSATFGRIPQPWAWGVNALLILQFPLVHSLLLTRRGGRWLSRLIPGPHGSGIVWWRAEGMVFWLIVTTYGLAWLMLTKASFDAGVEVQSGALGWMSLLARIKPRFPDMPTRGLFRVIRQPIYVAFALTLWTVPVWTPDQLFLAISYTAYCLLAPRLKERRFAARYGERFARYKNAVPYALPRLHRRGEDHNAQ
jgi:protein-S-isoprenylcysteine O-methyltransferase Ste14